MSLPVLREQPSSSFQRFHAGGDHARLRQDGDRGPPCDRHREPPGCPERAQLDRPARTVDGDRASLDGRGRGGDHPDRKSTSELQSLTNLVCRLLLEKKKKRRITK